MVDRNVESGNDLVLDNRKILGIFVAFIVACGIFFVLGFREGKRQGIQKGAQIAVEITRKANSIESPAQTSKPPATNAVAVTPKEDSGQQQVDWHKYVNRKEESTKDPAKKTATGTAGAAGTTGTTGATGAAKTPKPADAAKSGPIFSLRVGAFRVKSGAEKEAKTLRDKKYDCRIEEPKSAGGLYLVKVGQFKSRAEAVAMRSKLKESGINSDITTD